MDLIVKLIQNIHYFISLFLFLLGFYTMLAKSNLVKKMIGLNIMDTSIFLFLVSTGYIKGGKVPLIHNADKVLRVNPLPHALVLTGIVVSFSISVFGYALIIKIYSHYGTINTKEISKMRGNDK
ncbi:sodium:proton antiporter [Acetohalobium arabaticum]|uniref:Multisubunit sodium/proton antiporter, MrpC subunit (2.A.63.1) n=1 Tax=Acetohalobium arabaticum (strain ATCC 49924 / DSM 5501 / Z-7288) TaxID=574087 RepID=D9QQ28_ACEAZ|nr:cation:proton antiporter subunit C [Acetohalobium arabaticum]ADL12619.1 multisubunit sodium/proton antiporter, MrpC subunit (2.A.63.1) [Acetohalobium arabaticum DSM 5501]